MMNTRNDSDLSPKLSRSTTIVRLRPLTFHEIEAQLNGPAAIDGLDLSEDVVPRIVLTMAARALAQGQPPQWRQPQVFLLGDPGVAVGSAAFKGEPSNGRVEIGYGVASVYAGCGYATTGVDMMVAYAFSQPGVNEVYAETSIDNIASRRVVEKAGFTHIGQRECEEDGTLDQWLLSR